MMGKHGASGGTRAPEYARPVPDVCLVGAPRCGTTSLAEYFRQHPEMCVAEPKEPFFFERDFGRGTEWYAREFFHHAAPGQLKLDARVHNSWIGYVAPRIHKVSPGAKIVMIVRNPYEQVYSQWLQLSLMRHGRVGSFTDEMMGSIAVHGCRDLTLEREVVPHFDGHGGYYFPFYMEAASYHRNITRFKRLFSNLCVVAYDDLVANPAKIHSELCHFLGIKYMPGIKWSKANQNFGPAWRDVKDKHEGVRRRIQLCLQEEVGLLGDLMKRDFRSEWMI